MDAQLNAGLLDGTTSNQNRLDKDEDPRTWDYQRRLRELNRDKNKDTQSEYKFHLSPKADLRKPVMDFKEKKPRAMSRYTRVGKSSRLGDSRLGSIIRETDVNEIELKKTLFQQEKTRIKNIIT